MKFIIYHEEEEIKDFPPCDEASQEEEAYIVSFESLDDLQVFLQKYGDIVIGPWNETPIYRQVPGESLGTLQLSSPKYDGKIIIYPLALEEEGGGRL